MFSFIFFLGFVGLLILCVVIFQHLLFLGKLFLGKSLSHFPLVKSLSRFHLGKSLSRFCLFVCFFWIPDQAHAGHYNHLFISSASHMPQVFSFLQ